MLLARLLHPSYEIERSYFPTHDSFWDQLIKIGSSHLVLPAIYSSLKRKKLDHHAPKDLLIYLKEITNLNRRNNNEILKQISIYCKTFLKNKIEYVFLKGSAMLIFKPYKTVDDRMIGDIDILVSEKDLFKAKKVLIAANFQQLTSKFNFTKGVISQRHLKRLIHPNYISAVELHRRLLIDEKSDQINSRNILKNKIKTNKGYFIPSKNDLWLHAILNWQYNDNGYLFNTFSLRSFLDAVHLGKQEY